MTTSAPRSLFVDVSRVVLTFVRPYSDLEDAHVLPALVHRCYLSKSTSPFCPHLSSLVLINFRPLFTR